VYLDVCVLTLSWVKISLTSSVIKEKGIHYSVFFIFSSVLSFLQRQSSNVVIRQEIYSFPAFRHTYTHTHTLSGRSHDTAWGGKVRVFKCDLLEDKSCNSLCIHAYHNCVGECLFLKRTFQNVCLCVWLSRLYTASLLQSIVSHDH